MTTVDLARAGDRVLGSVGDQSVELALKVPASRAGIRGECLGAQIAGYWRIQSNVGNLDPAGLLLGEYDGQPVYLHSAVHLTPHYAVRYADVSGTVGTHELRAHIAPVEAPAYGPTVMEVDGAIDRDTITLIATAATDLSEAHITGLIGGRSVTINATRSGITGQYDGPAVLFPLLVSCLLYFF